MTSPLTARLPERDLDVLDPGLRARVEHAGRKVAGALLRERGSRAGWSGELSSSALSTATAVTALTLHLRNRAAVDDGGRRAALVSRGRAWLVARQNADGGWGDTPESISNLSTTVLGWAALGLENENDVATGRAIASAEQWIQRAAGSLEPAPLVRAIEDSYGADRTFSIPILTMCALCGRLGPQPGAWRRVRQLPFEIAALPQRWFAALKLPVVSYALPALIAIGQVRHGLSPTRNPAARWLRNRCRARTLEKLIRLQPENGGFLEATPLTSFVVMSLAALGWNDHVVVRRGIEFLENSVRADGSWPIDTNLATWVTTLAVNALLPGSAGVPPAPSRLRLPAADRAPNRRTGSDPIPQGGPEARAPTEASGDLSASDRMAIRDWLLKQQFRQEHPYTLAAPGGWAWTDLPGGVPDADDTAGALLALRRLGPTDPATISAAAAGITWLLNLQNRDGGIPTFCRGWGTLPFDRSSPDLTAHAIRAWLAWRNDLDEALGSRVNAALTRAAGFLAANQTRDGAWVPLWFGHQQHPAGENPVYGTSRVVPAWCELAAAGVTADPGPLERALRWLVSVQKSDGGWSGAPAAASSGEETAVAVEALASAWQCAALRADARESIRRPLQRGAGWIVSAVERDRWRAASPIGLYFAKLWYHERLYPVVFAAAALRWLAAVR